MGARPGPQTPADTRHLLVVEDDPDIGLVVRLTLEQGHIVTLVADLAQAREAFARDLRFDLVLLDVMLPDGNGLDLCREIKAAYPALPVVILTAYAHHVRQEAEARRCRADAFVAKPFDPERLDRLVAELLARAA
jgi:DNA-binding response OmpR family regulator